MDENHIMFNPAGEPFHAEEEIGPVESVVKEKRSSIMIKFVFWFLTIALLPMAISAYVSYDSSHRALKEEVTNSLIAIANNKANQIENCLQNKKAEVEQLAQMPDLFMAMEKYDEAFYSYGPYTHEYVEVDREYRPFLTYYQKLFGYDNVFFVSDNGDLIFSTIKKDLGRSLYALALEGEHQISDIFLKTKNSLQGEVSLFEHDAVADKTIAFISEPILKEAEFGGMLIVQMNNQEISDLINDYSGMGETGEAIIVGRKEAQAIVITPIRFDPDASFRRGATFGSDNGIDMQAALRKEKGHATLIDYRGMAVLSIWRYLPSFDLGLVVKMDTKEVFNSAKRLRDLLVKISMVLLLIVAVIAVVAAKTISSPIKELTETSRIIAKGDLSARSYIETNDEIGELSESFNYMTENLIEAKAKVEEERATVVEQAGLLQKANKELDSFVYTVSHDLRAPLRGITAFATFLKEDYMEKLDAEGKDHVKEIIKGADRMNKFIEDLLTLSRISRIKNPYEKVDIKKLIVETQERIKFDIKEYGVKLTVQDTFPVVYCDRIKINEVFLNLLNNAIKYSSKNKKEKPQVEIGCEDKGDMYNFFVKDNGIGIDPKDHEKVFGMFTRIQTAEQFEGTGAGLGIVHRIVLDHGGKIWVDSELGKGAAFYFSIPKNLKERKQLKNRGVE
ncbi:MAG: HAMP domain-containing protein [Candidatus Omnitrophica bacterium]|nr:HAMP domain-containing protein [Candidatus Omnitrophota bacterium]